MAHIRKQLTAADPTLILDIPVDQNGGGALQVLALNGANTVDVEASVDQDLTTNADVWAALTPAVSVSAVGITTFDCKGFSKIRARRSAGAGASVDVALGFGRGI